MTRGVSFRGACFRHARERYATVDEGTLEASARVGGRFNAPGEFGAIYVALERDTAVAELERRVTAGGFPREHFRSRVMVTLQASLTRVLDLTDPAVREDLGLSLALVTGENWPPTQKLAKDAREGGYSAIRFPSVTGKGDNLAIFLDKLGPNESLVVEDVDEIRLEP